MSIGTITVLTRAFHGLDTETVQDLRSVAQRKTYPPGIVLCKQGEIEHTFYVIVEGRVVVTRDDVEGEAERVLGMLGANGYFGEMGLIDDSPRMATCTTVVHTTVLELTEAEFDRLMVESPSLANTIIQKVLSHSRRMDQMYIDELQTKNVALQKAYDDLQAAQKVLLEKERLEHEIELAAVVQRSLLPADLPQFSDYTFAAFLTPARQVGGDFYDVIALDEEHIGILIADVADKGFHAAMFMAVSRTLFQQAVQHSLSPAQVVLAVHRSMFEVATNEDMFITAFYGVLHRPSGKLTYVRAAHDRPLLYRNGEVTALSGNGRFLGMILELELEEYTVQLQAGDRLIMYSDGVPDATNWEDAHYGMEQFTQLVKQHGDRSAAEITKIITEDVQKWCAGAPAADDLTLLILEANF